MVIDSERAPSPRALLLGVAAVGGVVAGVLPVASATLGVSVSFMPAVLALVISLDLVSAVLLLHRFQDTGERRSLVLAAAYLFALSLLVGFAASFPGVLGSAGPLGGWASTAPWLWVASHCVFPVIVAAALAPWPSSWDRPVGDTGRVSTMWRTAICTLGVSAAVVLVAATGSGWLPSLVDGNDSTALTKVTGPVMLPVVALAAIISVVGAVRIRGAVRWGSLAAVAVAGDALLTLSSQQRFGLGWYVGRSMGVVAAAVVLGAMLLEFTGLRRQLAAEARRLQTLVRRAADLEALQSTLLDLMGDGVVLRGADGRVLALNRAAQGMLQLSGEELQGRELVPLTRRMVRSDGSAWDDDCSPEALTLSTGVPQHDRVVGVQVPDSPTRWLRVNTTLTTDDEGTVQYVVSTLRDDTARHTAELARRAAAVGMRRRIQAVLDDGGPRMELQPIVNLRTGQTVGSEALARFDALPVRTPDVWFAEALTAGLGLELELAAVRQALALQRGLPAGHYLSVNVSPVTAASRELHDLVSAPGIDPSGLVFELTEHANVEDYDSLRVALTALRTLGARIAVDDAGAGYASLCHIVYLRPDIVKLDCALVCGVDGDPARRALAEALSLFAQRIGACLIAEGIECEADLSALRSVGVTHGQGFLLGRPAPPVRSDHRRLDGQRRPLVDADRR